MCSCSQQHASQFCSGGRADYCVRIRQVINFRPLHCSSRYTSASASQLVSNTGFWYPAKSDKALPAPHLRCQATSLSIICSRCRWLLSWTRWAVCASCGSSTFRLHLQILLVGDSGVGKSSLLMRFTADQFEESSVPTIGKYSLLYSLK